MNPLTTHRESRVRGPAEPHTAQPRNDRILAWLSDALDAVAGISQTLEDDWKLDRNPADVFRAATPALRRLADFTSIAYLSVDEEGLTFDLEVVEPDRNAALVRQELEHQVAEGTFAWSIYQNRAVVVPGGHLGPWVVLHPLATPARVMGMFIGSLASESAFLPDACQKVLSILLMNCASVMESGQLYRELNRHNQNLEAIIEERTEELRRSEENARQASRAKSEFLANMSHEIRTPINGIVGMNSLMLQGAMTPEQEEQAQTIRRSAENLLTLINDILDFSKIEAGRLSLEHAPYDLKVAAEDVVELLSAKAADKGIEVVTRWRSGTPRMVVGDSARMRQILTNLVSNAIKFTETGHVAVDIEWTPRAPGRGVVHAAVEDTGIGIDPTKLERIFEKFTQADSSTTRVYGGTGLGLSISRQLARLMGGELRADSVPGKGSTFFIDVPVEVDASLQADVHVPDLTDRRVVVVAPSAALRSAIKGQLDAWGAMTITTPKLESVGALMGAAATELGLVLVDLAYPPDELRAFAKWVHATSPNATCLLMSTMARREEAVSHLGPNYGDVLLKPVRERRLIQALAPIDRAERSAGALDPTPASLPSGGAPELVDDTLPRARVLLVEDEPVNRMVASQMLQKLGHDVDIAEHGAAAVERIEQAGFGHYDLVFMDCQTPVMDGFEATKQLRVNQHTLKAPHLNIIALTASALAGDRERCLAAGMDDYMAKPIRIEDVDAMLQKWLPRARIRPVESDPAPAGGIASPNLEPPAATASSALEGAPHAVTPSASAPPAGPAPHNPGPLDFDEEATMTQLAGDWSLFWTICDLFIGGWDDVAHRLEVAQQTGDLEALRQAAHFIKGGAANVGAARLRALAGDLEKAASRGDVPDPARSVAALKDAFAAYVTAVREVPRV